MAPTASGTTCCSAAGGGGRKSLECASNPAPGASDGEGPLGNGTLKRVDPSRWSELSERILPYVEALAKHLDLEVMLIGVYSGSWAAGGSGDGFYNTGQMVAFIASVRAETMTYLANKTEEMKRKGLNKVSFAAKEGLEADEIIALARETADTLIAMCTHGRSGVQRWMLGSVTRPWCAYF